MFCLWFKKQVRKVREWYVLRRIQLQNFGHCSHQQFEGNGKDILYIATEPLPFMKNNVKTNLMRHIQNTVSLLNTQQNKLNMPNTYIVLII